MIYFKNTPDSNVSGQTTFTYIFRFCQNFCIGEIFFWFFKIVPTLTFCIIFLEIIDFLNNPDSNVSGLTIFEYIFRFCQNFLMAEKIFFWTCFFWRHLSSSYNFIFSKHNYQLFDIIFGVFRTVWFHNFLAEYFFDIFFTSKNKK